MPIVTQAATQVSQEWHAARRFMSEKAKPCVNLSKGAEIVAAEPDGTYIYNVQKNLKTRISEVKVETCSSTTAYGYKTEAVNGQTLPQAYSFTLAQPEGTPIAHLPRYINKNQADVYALEFNPKAGQNGKNQLWYSPDAGKTWEERGQQLDRNISAYAVSYSDPKIIYVTVFVPPANPETATEHEYFVYSSQDGGKNWTQGAQVKVVRGCFGTLASLVTLEGGSSQTVELYTASFCAAIGATFHYSLSTDGARTFNKIGEYFRPARVITQLFATPKGTLLLKKDFDGKCLLAYLKDDGQPGKQLAFPFACDTVSRDRLGVSIQQNPNNPAVLIMSQLDTNDDSTISWISEDSGETWRQLTKSVKGGTVTVLTFAGNKPVVAMIEGFGFTYKILSTLVDTTRTAEVEADNKPGNRYFPETRHNLSGPFRTYWEQNGGLAQFGYPKTEVFQEVNPADGKTYDVQYFERNRFEYHPEHKGTKYEVLLGLLGNQLTEGRQAETPFKPLEIRAAVVNPNELYFPETGHTLKDQFKKYWEANGGLAMYGYPISEPFEEVSSDDGKTYIVQYFERNRFEYHPENKGTKYEVLLGLLGNTLMIQKGWL